MSVDPSLQYYSDLLIRQYKTAPKATQTVQLMANQSFIEGFPLEEAAAFDLDTCVGAQLDVIGRIVGVPRNVYSFDNTHLYFNMQNYVDTPNPSYTFGMGRYTDSPYDPLNTLFFRYAFDKSQVYTLLDFEMRILIKVKIFLNNSYSSLKQIIGILYEYFGTDIRVIDNKNFTMTYNVSSASNVAKAAASIGLLPKPMGVGLIVNFV